MRPCMCIKFQQVNLDTVKDAYLMQKNGNQLEAMVVSTVFKTLNLTKCYQQLMLYSKSKPVTAFLIPDGLY